MLLFRDVLLRHRLRWRGHVGLLGRRPGVSGRSASASARTGASMSAEPKPIRRGCNGRRRPQVIIGAVDVAALVDLRHTLQPVALGATMLRRSWRSSSQAVE
jgi:hypothetical protein